MDTLRKKMLIRAVLSPPTVSLPFLHVDDGKNIKRLPIKAQSTTTTHCRLCGDSLIVPPLGGGGVDPVETLRMIMTKVGLKLEEDLTFCPFCSSQLGNLVSLKKEMDVLGERLASMIIGLQSILSTTPPIPKPKSPLEKEEKAPQESERSEGVCVPGGQPFSCPVCALRFTTNGILSQHIQNHYHTVPPPQEVDVNPFPCLRCPRRFPSQDRLRFHELTHILSQEQRWPCPDCPKTFSTAGNLKIHSVCHNGERPYSCSTCPKSFSNRGNLKRHVMVQHEGFRRRQQRQHSQNGSPPRPFRCKLCPLSFYTKAHVERHFLAHRPEEERPFPCPQCPRRFTQKTHLKSHINCHLPSHQRPFRCPLCGQGFTRRDQLKAHNFTHHRLPEEAGNVSEHHHLA